MTLLNMTRDINGYNTFGLKFTDQNKSMALDFNTEQHFTVPSNFKNWLAIFSYESGADVWVANNATATYPTGAVADTTSQRCPTAREVQAGDVLSFITPETPGANVGVSLYALS